MTTSARVAAIGAGAALVAWVAFGHGAAPSDAVASRPIEADVVAPATRALATAEAAEAANAPDDAGGADDVHEDDARSKPTGDAVQFASVTGRVVDSETRAPIPRFRVLAYRPSPSGVSLSARLDSRPWRERADGSFAFLELSEPSYTFVVEAEGYLLGASDCVDTPPGSSTEVVVLLGRGARVRGRVVDAETGRGIADAFVTVQRNPLEARALALRSPLATENLADRHTARTDEQGAFELAAMVPGKIRVVARDGVHADGESGEVAVQYGVHVLPPIALLRTATVEGVALDADGKPIPGGWLIGRPMDGRRWPLPITSIRSTRLEEDGSFRLSSLAPGEWSLEAKGMNYASTSAVEVPPVAYATFTLAPGSTTRVTLRSSSPPGCRVRGRLLREGKGLAEFSMKLGVPIDDVENGLAILTALDGRFTIERVPPGRWSLTIHDGAVEQREWLVVPAAESVDVEVVLPAGGSIRGRVVDEDGRPVERATVHVDGEGWPSATAGSGFPFDPAAGVASPAADAAASSTASASTKKNGRFAIPSLLPGRYRVTVEGPQLSTNGERFSYVEARRTVDVTDEATTDAEIRLVRAGWVKVTVLRDDGLPAIGATVRLVRLDAAGDDSPKVCWGFAMDDGVAHVDGVPAGTWRAEATARGGFGASRPLSVALREETSVHIDLHPTRTILVRAIGPDGKPAILDRIAVRDEHDIEVWAARPPGQPRLFRLDVPRGKATVSITSGASSGSARVEAGESGPEEILVKVDSPPTGERR
ncbi:MAG TPA: carboxypeptidase-like regulatory domain-containing protein [Planctomycetota bacterium]|nr:carboxypeptidase-like regulatory domain-containing protein [Planctomycetota bacterium]